jgi:transcriptional regulator with XRE-family HTH domain
MRLRNALYLSQIENNKIQQPSPNVLFALSEAYGLDYGRLMEIAGHITPSKGRTADQRHGRVATFAGHNLTEAEEAELIDFIQHIRNRKRPGGQA